MAHTWPQPVRPIVKANRTCAACGLTATAVKYKHTERVDYRWGIAWRRGAESGIVDKLRELPACTGTTSDH